MFLDLNNIEYLITFFQPKAFNLYKINHCEFTSHAWLLPQIVTNFELYFHQLFSQYFVDVSITVNLDLSKSTETMSSKMLLRAQEMFLHIITTRNQSLLQIMTTTNSKSRCFLVVLLINIHDQHALCFYNSVLRGILINVNVQIKQPSWSAA